LNLKKTKKINCIKINMSLELQKESFNLESLELNEVPLKSIFAENNIESLASPALNEQLLDLDTPDYLNEDTNVNSSQNMSSLLDLDIMTNDLKIDQVLVSQTQTDSQKSLSEKESLSIEDDTHEIVDTKLNATNQKPLLEVNLLDLEVSTKIEENSLANLLDEDIKMNSKNENPESISNLEAQKVLSDNRNIDDYLKSTDSDIKPDTSIIEHGQTNPDNLISKLDTTSSKPDSLIIEADTSNPKIENQISELDTSSSNIGNPEIKHDLLDVDTHINPGTSLIEAEAKNLEIENQISELDTTSSNIDFPEIIEDLLDVLNNEINLGHSIIEAERTNSENQISKLDTISFNVENSEIKHDLLDVDNHVNPGTSLIEAETKNLEIENPDIKQEILDVNNEINPGTSIVEAEKTNPEIENHEFKTDNQISELDTTSSNIENHETKQDLLGDNNEINSGTLIIETETSNAEIENPEIKQVLLDVDNEINPEISIIEAEKTNLEIENHEFKIGNLTSELESSSLVSQVNDKIKTLLDYEHQSVQSVLLTESPESKNSHDEKISTEILTQKTDLTVDLPNETKFLLDLKSPELRIAEEVYMAQRAIAPMDLESLLNRQKSVSLMPKLFQTNETNPMEECNIEEPIANQVVSVQQSSPATELNLQQKKKDCIIV
jgi:hypothetical protein